MGKAKPPVQLQCLAHGGQGIAELAIRFDKAYQRARAESRYFLRSTGHSLHVATPVPKKSASSVQIGHSSASAVASTGQSFSSRFFNRLREIASNRLRISALMQPIKIVNLSSTAIADSGWMFLFSRISGRCSRASAKALSGAINRTLVKQVSRISRTRFREPREPICSHRAPTSHMRAFRRLRRTSLNSFTSSSSVEPLAATSASSRAAAVRRAARCATSRLGRAGM
jgi:hypothetical protein